MKKKLVIATRKSPLALWQAEFIKAELQALHPDLHLELLSMTTEGDRSVDMKLLEIGGKGLFVKELEQALLDGRADIAVHSIKDVTVNFPDGLHMPVICERADPFDAFVSNKYSSFSELPHNAVLGTSSLRRQAQLRAARPDLKVVGLRGNVNTRLNKLDTGEFDAIILATSGLQRLNFDERIKHSLDSELCLPAVGQGALGIECRSGDSGVEELIRPLYHKNSALCVLAERTVNAKLDGGCHVPIAAYATLKDGQMFLRGRVGLPDGSKLIHAELNGVEEDYQRLGEQLANDMLGQGAGEILAEIV